jgi:hypothetical protein
MDIEGPMEPPADKPIPIPTREDVERVLADLAEGRISREQASDWAGQWLPKRVESIDDRVVRKGLWTLRGADLPTIDRDYLHGEEDFRAWLEEFREADGDFTSGR